MPRAKEDLKKGEQEGWNTGAADKRRKQGRMVWTATMKIVPKLAERLFRLMIKTRRQSAEDERPGGNADESTKDGGENDLKKEEEQGAKKDGKLLGRRARTQCTYDAARC